MLCTSSLPWKLDNCSSWFMSLHHNYYYATSETVYFLSKSEGRFHLKTKLSKYVKESIVKSEQSLAGFWASITFLDDDIIGSCLAAGFISCCTSGDCRGSPPTCSCDVLCRDYSDCCSDAYLLCDDPATVTGTVHFYRLYERLACYIDIHYVTGFGKRCAFMP